MDEQAFRRVLSDVLDERARVDQETHRAHHAFVAHQIESAQRRQEMWRKVQAHVLGWIAVSVICGGVYWLGAALVEFAKVSLRAKVGGP
jgi:hypothetical protein